MALIRGLFWLALFILFTFSFLVLFEYGPNDFTTGFPKEAQKLEKWVEKVVHPPKKQTSP